jgi:hypothetical protein
MRLFNTLEAANAALVESGGWIVQTANNEYWHCRYNEECIDLLTHTGAQRSLAHRYVRNSDDEGKYTIDAREFVADYAEPLRELEFVGLSADWIDEAWIIDGDKNMNGEHSVILLDDETRNWRIIRRLSECDKDGNNVCEDPLGVAFSTPREAIEAFNELTKGEPCTQS